MAATVFAATPNQFASTLGSAYTTGSGQFVMVSGAGAKLSAAIAAQGITGPSASHPVYVTVIRAAALDSAGRITDPTQTATYKATGLSGDTLTGVAAAQGSTDIAFSAGDTIGVFDTGGLFQDAYNAINALETATTASTPGAHTVFADSGGGNPSFRALAAADIPALDAGVITTGTFAAARLPIMGASGAAHAIGAVPDPGSTAGSTRYLREDGTWQVPSGGGGGTGTVTSVGLVTPGVLFSVSGSPVTTAGNLTLAMVNQTANTFLAGPTSGGAAAPTMRGLVDADLGATHAALTTQANTFTANQVIDGLLGVGLSPSFAIHGLGAGLRLQALATPTAPTVTPNGTTGATTYSYYLVATDAAGRKTAPSPVGQTTTGNATLSGTNFNAITWSAVPGAVSYDVLKGDTGHSIALAVAGTSFNDTGTATAAYTAPGRNATADAVFDGAIAIGGNGTSGGSSSTPDVQFANPATANPVIGWNPTNAGTGLLLYSGSTQIARFQDNGSCLFSSFGTTTGMNVGNFYIQRGTATKLSLGNTGQPAVWAQPDSQSYLAGFRADAGTGSGCALAAYVPNGAANDLFRAQSGTSSSPTTLYGLDKLGRPYTSNTTPTIAAGTGAGSGGTGGSVSIAGTDVNGVVTVATPTGGTAPAASAVVATATFSAAYGSAPKVVLLAPANAAAAALSGNGAVFADAANLATTGFALSAGSTALAAGVTYKWFYHVLG